MNRKNRVYKKGLNEKHTESREEKLKRLTNELKQAEEEGENLGIQLELWKIKNNQLLSDIQSLQVDLSRTKDEWEKIGRLLDDLVVRYPGLGPSYFIMPDLLSSGELRSKLDELIYKLKQENDKQNEELKDIVKHIEDNLKEKEDLQKGIEEC